MLARLCRPATSSIVRTINTSTSQRMMATASKVQLSSNVGSWPEYYRPGISEGQTKTVTEQLQENHDQHHIFFHPDRLHNHVVHHQLAIWALNASSEDLKKAYKHNKSYQKPLPPLDQDIVKTLNETAVFMKHAGAADSYANFLQFFRNEIDQHGWQETLQKYMFSGSEEAETMLVRMFGGFLHPIIHLGYGIEFKQPAIVAEALAQAACHEAWIGDFLIPAEKAAKDKSSEPPATIVDLLDAIHDDEKLKVAAHWEDGNKIRHGIIPRAGKEMIDYASRFRVAPDQLDQRTAEMTNAVCLYTAAAQHAPQMVMWDFYFMHCVNSSIFFPAFNKQPWLSTPNKARLLEYKVRMDLAMYASRRCPAIQLAEIRSYTPQHPSPGWDGIQDRVCAFLDDGHAAKLVRALAHGQRICAPYEDRAEFRVKRDDWLAMGHMAIDSVENTRRFDVATWVRSAGFEEAWREVPLRAQL